MGGLYREGLLVSAEYKTKEETGRGQEYLKMYQRPGDDAGCRATEEEEEDFFEGQIMTVHVIILQQITAMSPDSGRL